MMDIQEIEVKINKNGKVEIHVKGFKGDECILVTQDLENALGGEVDVREFLAEYFEVHNNQDRRDHLNLKS
jgi:hypothetical protein